jgi:ADP-ribose pyrophosphatase
MKMVLHDKPIWADDEDCSRYKWNSLDENIDRCSHLGQYKIVNGRPQNPIGRTGITGRGQLGKWGPNHAADPIVTR